MRGLLNIVNVLYPYLGDDNIDEFYLCKVIELDT